VSKNVLPPSAPQANSRQPDASDTKNLASASTLKDSAVPSPTTQQIPAMMALIRRRLLPERSTQNATAGSSMEIAELQAAIATNTKKITPKTWPIITLPKAIGSVTNIRPGPALGSRPAANTIGNSARPAVSATTVSSSATVSTVPPMEDFFGMYEPNTMIEPTPMLRVKNAWPIAARIPARAWDKSK